MRQLIYVHGFKSDAAALKGQMLADYAAVHAPHLTVVRPDFNCPPSQAQDILAELLTKEPQSALVGSSLGGFYAMWASQYFDKKTVLVNPSIYPFQTMNKYFSEGQPSFTTPGGWTVLPSHISELEQMFFAQLPHPTNILALLKTGDEILDYQVAQHYFGDAHAGDASPIVIVEDGGDHFMTDFEDKLPQIFSFFGV